MHSLKTKITLFTVSVIIAVIAITTFLSAISIKNLGTDTSNQLLFLLCEEGEKNLDNYFSSIEQSVETVSSYAESDLKNSDIKDLGAHIKRVEDIFEKTANNTNGILTYYYRIDPTISTTEKGFWYVDLDGEGFTEHEVTDITLYDTADQSKLVWFTVPKATGKSVWLTPYYTDNLDVYVLSYNVPIRKDDTFIGVIGIEIDYKTIIEPVKNITLYNNGYAFINDADGNIIYHPRMDVSEFTGENKLKVPDGLITDTPYITYEYNNVKKQAVWLPLSNGMRLNVTVPLSEINAGWLHLTDELFFISLLLLLIFIPITMRLSSHITKPLQQLAKVAKQVDEGDYSFDLDYNKNDEVGVLTNAFKQLVSHLKVYIKDLNDLAYSDPLTSVHNKGAFDIYIREIQEALDKWDEPTEFAIGIFDCNDLKMINDQFGHEYGDRYLKSTVSRICKTFSHSPVFRTGGDEFAVILKNEDYAQREKLISSFENKIAKTMTPAKKPWEQLSIAIGVAVYDANKDRTAEDVIRRADKLMYEDKRRKKA